MDEIEWNVVNEGKLFDAMVDHKPVGINKYFEMAIICEKLSESMQKEVEPEKIWDHLKTLYNLEALDESESIPFPNTEKNFTLPESEYGSLISKKEEEKEKVKAQAQKGRETPKIKEQQRKEEKIASKTSKETPRRDSKDSKDSKSSTSSKKEVKKESEKPKNTPKGRNSIATSANDKSGKGKSDDTPKLAKRPTRGSLKPNDDSGSSGKSSPITVTPSAKRRRI